MPTLTDHQGRTVGSTAEAERPAGRLVQLLAADRAVAEVSRDLGPAEVERILANANAGDQEEQAKLAAEILEKDWDIAQAVQTRAAAVIGTAWRVAPADDTPRAREVAAWVEAALRGCDGAPDEGLDSFPQLLASLLTAYLPGFAVSEIVWREGGAGVLGFQFIPQHHFSFRDSLQPRLRLPGGEAPWALPPNRFIIHRYAHRPGDLVRGGLIRPLAWLYAFKRLTVSDLFRYLEKFGMPFILARLDDRVWEQERRKVATLIRHFASDGGGVFSKGVEIELVKNTFAQEQGRVFHDVLAYLERAINRLVLGQTSTADSRDANRSTAAVHELVRQDLRADDCAALAETVRQYLVRPLVQFNFGVETPVPPFRFLVEAEHDLERDARILAHLAQAGYRVRDPEALRARFGYDLTVAEPAGK